MQHVDWGDLPVLLALSRCDTMTAAAKTLGINQTTVARRIDALEETLGVQLVERRRDGISLTEEGIASARAAEQMEGVAIALERALVGGSARLAGTVRITTADMIAVGHPDLFSSFARKFPDIELEVVTGYAVQSLARREADVAIRLTPKPAEHLFGRKLGRLEYGVYGSSALVAEVGRRTRLDRYPWLGWTKEVGARGTEAWMKEHVPDAKIIGRHDTALPMHAAAADGAGLLLMPCVYGDAHPELVRLRGPIDGLGYDLWVLTHEDLARTARVRAFLRHVGEYFDERRGALSGRGTKRRR